MLGCGNSFFWFRCHNCNKDKIIHLGCNSRLCTHCGKRYTDRWASQVAKHTLNVVHRHTVFTIAEQLRPLFQKHPELFKVLMDCTIETVTDMMREKHGKDIVPGVIAVLHTYGKDMKFNPHVHTLVTEGGFTKTGKWVPFRFFPFEILRKEWQRHVLTKFKDIIPQTEENDALITGLFTKYPDGFYVHAPLKSRIINKKQMMKYIGRYIRHPAVAESRIENYDGKHVTFFYEDHEEQIHHVTMEKEEFITSLIRHIPDKQFKTIRYYGIYYRVKKKHFKELNGMISIVQKTLPQFIRKWAPDCENCGCKMEFVDCWINKPPNTEEFGKKITDWCYL